MRKLLIKMSVSVDLFVGGPNGEIDWLFPTTDAEATDWTLSVIWKAGLHIMGSRTFHDMASYWPASTEVFAAPMNEIPKAVFTRKGIDVIGDAGKTTTVLKNAGQMMKEKNLRFSETAAMDSWKEALVLTGDLADEVRKLKAQPGKNIIAHGGASFCQSLVATGLVDEYHLLIHPVVLGKGLPLFSAAPERIGLKLMAAKAFPAGAVAHSYGVV
ncbi:MAG TPA: dihydrofolate reductase family protein [Puia sp.]|jgi:dihydrofolate reductase|nr:dihydrofolate reductase family protein [Puia sp.]